MKRVIRPAVVAANARCAAVALRLHQPIPVGEHSTNSAKGTTMPTITRSRRALVVFASTATIAGSLLVSTAPAHATSWVAASITKGASAPRGGQVNEAALPLAPVGAYTPLGPVRVLDTRSAVGVSTTTAVPAHQTVSLRVAGVAGVPASGVTGVAMNVTVTQPTSFGVLNVYPDSQAQPVASNLNWIPGQTVPNMVIVQVVDGSVDFFNNSSGTIHVVADLNGYFTQ